MSLSHVLKGYFPKTLMLSPGFSHDNIYTEHLPKFMNTLGSGYEYILRWMEDSSHLFQSKRPQDNKIFEHHMNLSNCDMDKPFIFVPMQYSEDITIRCSKFDYLEHILSVAKLCKHLDVNMVIKFHPRAYEHNLGEKQRVDDVVSKCISICNVIVDFGDIRQLMKKSLITVVASSESVIMDACAAGVNIISCAPHMFMDTQVSIYDKDLFAAYQKSRSSKLNREEQAKLLWWTMNCFLLSKDICTYNPRFYIDRMISLFMWIDKGRPHIDFLFGLSYEVLKDKKSVYDNTGKRIW